MIMYSKQDEKEAMAVVNRALKFEEKTKKEVYEDKHYNTYTNPQKAREETISNAVGEFENDMLHDVIRNLICKYTIETAYRKSKCILERMSYDNCFLDGFDEFGFLIEKEFFEEE